MKIAGFTFTGSQKIVTQALELTLKFDLIQES